MNQQQETPRIGSYQHLLEIKKGLREMQQKHNETSEKCPICEKVKNPIHLAKGAAPGRGRRTDCMGVKTIYQTTREAGGCECSITFPFSQSEWMDLSLTCLMMLTPDQAVQVFSAFAETEVGKQAVAIMDGVD